MRRWSGEQTSQRAPLSFLKGVLRFYATFLFNQKLLIQEILFFDSLLIKQIIQLLGELCSYLANCHLLLRFQKNIPIKQIIRLLGKLPFAPTVFFITSSPSHLLIVSTPF